MKKGRSRASESVGRGLAKSGGEKEELLGQRRGVDRFSPRPGLLVNLRKGKLKKRGGKRLSGMAGDGLGGWGAGSNSQAPPKHTNGGEKQGGGGGPPWYRKNRKKSPSLLGNKSGRKEKWACELRRWWICGGESRAIMVRLQVHWARLQMGGKGWVGCWLRSRGKGANRGGWLMVEGKKKRVPPPEGGGKGGP